MVRKYAIIGVARAGGALVGYEHDVLNLLLSMPEGQFRSYGIDILGALEGLGTAPAWEALSILAREGPEWTREAAILALLGREVSAER